jgi:hypothetical protein
MTTYNAGYTGRLLEAEVLPQCTDTLTCHLPYKVAMARVRMNQPAGWNPKDPASKCMNNFHTLVAEALETTDYSELKLFSAVGSPLDFFHGVDAFFEFQGRIVTIDVTKNPHKLEGKADFILQECVLEDEIALQAYAEGIAKCFSKRVQAAA